ncbi:MAG: KUP/HAK/KT family potassium transporter [Ignavibacteria bacterium]|nr:KUP/HAK/KT family potassium transporter [Ignavibacteria bacterium]NCS82069.1 KUP/HAK/KT family potassium transporter [Ignavibacteria bacterium]OIO17000.1 MAG: potassium transporter Kup [Ignavibacteria bacterium CG1_02_37_35]PIX95421.1 MAG: potassium transporter Kup [Ignavibacteria bacterium CG_4_10_14_3_um_filter_37_18]
MKFKISSFSDIVKAMGLVFGDIGTSPIYTLVIVFTLTRPSHDNLFGILSLIFWTLIILVTIEYAWLAMSLSIKGEGGVIVLKEVLSSFVKKGKKATIVAYLGYFGISLLMGDGVITPAISILSAVEGLPLIHGFEWITGNIVILITMVITIILFAFQYKGTDKVASSFGPIMIIWFISLFISGFISILNMPSILLAISPTYAISFLTHNGLAGILVLSEVILCATGGEALYADMGHLGALPIRRAWGFVFAALIFNYFGQGAYILVNHTTDLVLFQMVKSQAEFLYIPFIILTIFATIIASQAMISAVFSLVYQGITTRIFPLMKIKYTSTHIKSQIYIGAVNWGLLVAVLFMILLFKASSNLAAAYGLAVTITMTISSILMVWIFKHKKSYLKMSMAAVVFLVDLLFLFSLTDKLQHGGYWSLIIAAVPFTVTLIWIAGQKTIYRSFRSLPLDTFKIAYEQIYNRGQNIDGTALFFSRTNFEIPPYVAHCIISSNIIYDKNILVSIMRTDNPYGVESGYVEDLAIGLHGLTIKLGYMEVVDLTSIIKKHNINEKVIFYGVEDIVTSSFMLKLYSFFKKLTPNFVQFYKLPYRKIHGVVTRIEI